LLSLSGAWFGEFLEQKEQAKL